MLKKDISDKLEPKTDRCIFVAYPKETRDYYLYNPIENKVFVTRFGAFLEVKILDNKNEANNHLLEEEISN